jgi:hypothetical protein
MPALISVLLVFSTTLAVTGSPRSQTSNKELSARETQEVERFVQTFGKRLSLTRDLSPFLTEPIASTKTLDKVLLDKEDSLPFVSHDLISMGNIIELRRFWIAWSNLAYLSELYVYSRMSVIGLRIYELPHAKQYPPKVERVMRRNPILSKWWEKYDSDSSEQIAKSIEQVRGLTSTFQKAASLMRARFKAHPPEQTARYRKNVASLFDYMKMIDVDTCDTEQDCAGLPLHTKMITVNTPILTLMLARIDGRLRILIVGIIDD